MLNEFIQGVSQILWRCRGQQKKTISHRKVWAQTPMQLGKICPVRDGNEKISQNTFTSASFIHCHTKVLEIPTISVAAVHAWQRHCINSLAFPGRCWRQVIRVLQALFNVNRSYVILCFALNSRQRSQLEIPWIDLGGQNIG